MLIKKIQDLNLFDKKVLIRADLNVPINNRKIISYVRIESSLDTIKYAIDKGAYVILTSHLGRPIEGKYDKNFSLRPIVNYLKKKLKNNIILVKNYLNKDNLIFKSKNDILVLENVRFNKGEISNSDNLSKKYAKLCDIFVMDAFATSHRKNSSTYGIIKFANISCIGILFNSEIKALSKIISNPLRPMVSIVGGAKISTKFNLLNSLSKISDNLIVGGGISNTFISVKNNVGKSLYEKSYKEIAKSLLNKYNNIIVPIDCRVAKGNISKFSKSYVKDVDKINNDEEIMDFGDKTIKLISKIIINAKTILWNGPVGVFEFKNFRKGTESISKFILKSNAYIVAGGGDTISAIELFNIKNNISYISTGGGAFLKFIECKELPVINILKKKNKIE